MKLPMWLFPKYWGLKGDSKEIAIIEYYEDDPFIRDMKINEIANRFDDVQKKKTAANIKLAHGKISKNMHQCEIFEAEGNTKEANNFKYKDMFENGEYTEYEYEMKIAKNNDPSGIREAEVQYEFGYISKHEMEKTIANINKTPWVAVTESEYDPEHVVDGFSIQLDWNELWIELLRSEGYEGITDEEIVDKWFESVCRGVLLEGVEAGYNFNSNSIIEKRQNDDNTTDYR
jgi:hypothetical protein